MNHTVYIVLKQLVLTILDRLQKILHDVRFVWLAIRGGGNIVETNKLFIVLLFLNTIFGSFNIFNSGDDNNSSV